ncbi:unnamed protein product [Eruca vesicaria subsp. sativa]|uniref:Peptidase S24/S26A/S26B/S26C domain-containing protein n=1 Tax=Eruca vesicaria subsp. sativa TaxID=29727 RepID=A0ABC8JNR2_ERUVS|nr:unnamed protein product [Eruca vesicaria subsp. sativa]
MDIVLDNNLRVKGTELDLMGSAGAKAVVAQSDTKIFFSNSVVTGEIYPLDSEVRVCDESRTGDVATVELREGDRVLVNHTTEKEYKLKTTGDTKLNNFGSQIIGVVSVLIYWTPSINFSKHIHMFSNN